MASHAKTNHSKPRLQNIFANFNKPLPSVNKIVGENISDVKNNNDVLNEKEIQNLGNLLSIYRSKKEETFRYIFLDKNNNIIEHLGISSHLPNLSKIHLSYKKNKTFRDKKAGNDFLNLISQFVKENNLKLVVAHNHPSGNITPSSQDIVITNKIELTINELGRKNRFLGHIILDHGKFNFYNPNGKWKMENEIFNPNWFLSNLDIDRKAKTEWEEFKTKDFEKPDNLLKKKANKYPDFILKYANDIKILEEIRQNLDAKGEWNLQDYTPIFCLNNANKPVGIKFLENKKVYEISKDENKIKQLKTDFKKIGRKFGIRSFIPFITNEEIIKYFENIEKKENMFLDICVKDKNGIHSWVKEKDKEPFSFDFSTDKKPSFYQSENFKKSKFSKKIKNEFSYNER